MDDRDRLIAARLRSLARLVRATAHETRGASGTMAIHLQLLRDTLPEVEDVALRQRQQRYLGVLESERHRLQTVVDAFLDRVALPDVREAEVDLGSLVAEVVQLLQPMSTERRVTLRAEGVDLPLRVETSRDALQQLLLDLLLLALEETPAGETFVVRVEGAGERASVVLHSSHVGSLAPTFRMAHATDWDDLARRAGGALRAPSDADASMAIVLPALGCPERRADA